jgi:hypothetical protein
MPRQFEFADSEISHIRSTPEGCSIDFSAALITEMVQGQASRSFSNGLRLVLHPIPAPTAPQASGFGLLAAGMLRVGGQRYSALPVPCHFEAESMVLHLQFADDLQLELPCQSLLCEATEQAREVEVLAC